MTRKSFFTHGSISGLLVGTMFWTFCVVAPSNAQRPRASAVGAIDAGTTISVRTNEDINVNDDDGRVFSGAIDKDVLSRTGNVAIPKGSAVELVVREVAD